MKQTDIVRESVDVLTVDSLTESLHQQAADVLGYSCASRTNLDGSSDSNVLRAAIGRLGIEILNTQSVHKYMGEMLAKRFARMDSDNFDWSWRSDPAWGRVKLSEYKKPVPDFAIERAIQLKRECPQVEFWVEELSDAVDPFLIAHIGREGYYIACWEEARFEAQL